MHDERRFQELMNEHGGAIQRLCRAYEHDGDRRRDLHQEVLVAVWRSLPGFRDESAVRTWVLRIAHNVAADWVSRRVRYRVLVAVEDLDGLAASHGELELDRRRLVQRMYELVDALKPLDRQVVLLWLEGVPHDEIADVTGLTVTHVSTKIHRLKATLAARSRP